MKPNNRYHSTLLSAVVFSHENPVDQIKIFWADLGNHLRTHLL